MLQALERVRLDFAVICKEIKLPSNLTVLSDSLFGADANLEYITFGDAEKTDTVIIPETVQKNG